MGRIRVMSDAAKAGRVLCGLCGAVVPSGMFCETVSGSVTVTCAEMASMLTPDFLRLLDALDKVTDEAVAKLKASQPPRDPSAPRPPDVSHLLRRNQVASLLDWFRDHGRSVSPSELERLAVRSMFFRRRLRELAAGGRWRVGFVRELAGEVADHLARVDEVLGPVLPAAPVGVDRVAGERLVAEWRALSYDVRPLVELAAQLLNLPANEVRDVDVNVTNR